jgi:hypothetical protein
MTTAAPKDPESGTSRSEELTARELALLAQNYPKTYDKLMAAERHRMRREWADVIIQGVGHIAGLAALSILAIVAWHAFDLNDATEGAAVICTGAVSIVTVFVTGRLTTKTTRQTTVKSGKIPA